MSSGRLQDISSSPLEDVFSVTTFLSSKTPSRRLVRCLQDVLKKSWWRLGRGKIVTLKTYWKRLENMPGRCLEDVLKTKKCLQAHYLIYLWQAHYLILSIIFVKEVVKLTVNSDMMIKYVKHVKLNISIATVFLSSKILQMI